MKALEHITLLNCVVKNHWNANLQLLQLTARLAKMFFCHLQTVAEYYKSDKLPRKFALFQNKNFSGEINVQTSKKKLLEQP